MPISCKGGRTQQQFGAVSDINAIVDRAQRSGMVPGNAKQPMYGDLTKVKDYQSALNAVMLAEHTFNDLPARVRDRFANDPAKMMDFLADKANYDEAVKLGLVVPKPKPAEPAVMKVEVVNSIPPKE